MMMMMMLRGNLITCISGNLRQFSREREALCAFHTNKNAGIEGGFNGWKIFFEVC